MTATQDGGWNALSGFLCQVIAALGMQTWPNKFNGRSPNEDELEGLLALARDARVHHERFDADIVLQPLKVPDDNQCTLVQFKYSRQSPPPPIGPAALKGIADGLHSAKKRAKGQGLCVNKYFLVSNRRLGPEADQLLESVRQGGLSPLPSPLTRLNQVCILERLRTIAIPQTTWEEALHRFAFLFGAEDSEIEKGIDHLVGCVFRQVAAYGTVTIRIPDLIEAFTGCPDARPLTPEPVVECSEPSIESSPISLPATPLRRPLLDALAQAIADRRALVVLHGEGGCGKSVALKQWALELVTSSPPDTGAFTMLELARLTPPQWIARTISQWANLPDSHTRHHDEHGRALARLKRANLDLPFPIMHLALDGMDEDPSAGDLDRVVRRLIIWFWKEDKQSRQESRPPRAVLVVTCRDQDKLLNHWLTLDVTGRRHYGEIPCTLEVDRFSSRELLQAAFETGSSDLYGRIKAVLDPLVGGTRSSVTVHKPVAVTAAAPPPPANRQVVEALHHPAMWGSLLELPPKLQGSALAGEPDGLQKMAKIFVVRFCTVACLRHRAAGLEEVRLLFLLRAIARHCRSSGRLRYSDSNWLSPAREFGLGELAARGLQNEALSGGLIVRKDSEATSWRWCHTLVWDYLAADDMSSPDTEHEEM